MYDPIFSKSFNRHERKRFGFCALILCFIIALSLSSSFKPHLHPLSVVGNAVNLQLSINAEEDNPNQTVGSSANVQTSAEKCRPAASQLPIIPSSENEMSIKGAAVCRVLEGNADYCEFEGEVRVDSNTSTVFLMITAAAAHTTSWVIQPYPRKGIPYVKNWTILATNKENNNIPKCSKKHSLPAILFSLGGFSGNHFHDFADLIVPLYSTSSHLKRKVHFLATDYKPWWPSKYRKLLDMLTKHAILDIDREKLVNCYTKIILGLRFHKELIINSQDHVSPLPGITQEKTNIPSMSQFRQLLRETYSLKRKEALKWKKGGGIRPRLVIISRKKTRIITNEGEIHRAARKQGYEVILAEGETSANLTEFGQLVNSCDVMMGVHGAGLTNMVFLPDNAILIQVVPLGGIDVFAKLDFGNPAEGMKIRYLEHKIGMKESSLLQQYGINDPVIRDPMSIHRKGWDHLRKVYLDNQNVTIDVPRFRATLSKALTLLRPSI
ncbi:hypothetical protein ACS0TY_023904 [Phlomoides rotata]